MTRVKCICGHHRKRHTATGEGRGIHGVTWDACTVRGCGCQEFDVG